MSGREVKDMAATTAAIMGTNDFSRVIVRLVLILGYCCGLKRSPLTVASPIGPQLPSILGSYVLGGLYSMDASLWGFASVPFIFTIQVNYL